MKELVRLSTTHNPLVFNYLGEEIIFMLYLSYSLGALPNVLAVLPCGTVKFLKILGFYEESQICSKVFEEQEFDVWGWR